MALDVAARLGPWLELRLDAVGPVCLDELRRHAEGFSWQTYTFLARWTDGAGETRSQGLAVRRQPEDGLLAPYDIEGQYALHARLEAHSRVPIPPLRWLELDPDVLGMPFYVTDRLDGTVPVPWEPDGRGVFDDDARRAAIGRQFVDALALVHCVPDVDLIPSLWRPRSASDVAGEAVELWYGEYVRAVRSRLPLVEEAVAWLRAHPRASGRLTLCHGDYRIGNVMIDRDDRLNAVFDWELAHVGDPVQDIAWAALRLFRGRSPRWSHLLDGPAFLARYQERTGHKVDSDVFAFWTVVNYVKAISSYLRATRAFEEGRVGDLRLAAMGHQVVFLLRLLRDELAEQGVR